MNKLHEVVQKFRSSSESSDKGSSSSFPLSEDEAGGGHKGGKGDRGVGASPDSIFTTGEASQPLNPALLSQQSQGGSTRSRPWSGFLPDLSFPSTKIPSSASASGDLSSVGSDQPPPHPSTTANPSTATATTNQDGGGGSAGEVFKAAGMEHRQLLQQQLPHSTTERTRTNSKSKKKQPPGTFEYTIKDRDTLASIAARHELTPSELMKVNRLISRTVFAGQILFIPDPNYVPPPAPSSTTTTTSSTSDTPKPLHHPATVTSPDVDPRPKVDVPLTALADRSPSSVPGHVIKLSSPPSTPSSAPAPPTPVTRQLSKEEDEHDRECHQKFVKIRSRRILEDGDHGHKDKFGSLTCKGTLLVTPNAIMFDPDVSDDYVIDNGGQAKFSAVIYMENIKGAVLLPDTSSRFFWRQPEELRGKSPKPAVYRPDRDAPDTPDGPKHILGAPDGPRAPADGCSSADRGTTTTRSLVRTSPEGAGSPDEEDKVGGRMSEELENMKDFSQCYGMSISTPGRTSEEIASTFTSDPSPSSIGLHQKHSMMSRSSELAVSEISLFEEDAAASQSYSKMFGETRDFGPHMGLSSSDIINRHDSVSSQSNQMVHSPGVNSPGVNSPGVEQFVVNNNNGSGGQAGGGGGINTPTQGFAPVFFTDRSPSSAMAAPKPVPGQKAGGMLLAAPTPIPAAAAKTCHQNDRMSGGDNQNDYDGDASAIAQQNRTGSANTTATTTTTTHPSNTQAPTTANTDISQRMQNLNISQQAPVGNDTTTITTAPSDWTDSSGSTSTPTPSSSTTTTRAPPSSSSIPSSSHSSSFSPLRNPAQHLSSFINYTTGFFKAGEAGGASSSSTTNNNISSNKTSPSSAACDETCGGMTGSSNSGTPKSGGRNGKGRSAFPFPSSLIPEAISSNFPSFPSLMSSSQTGPQAPSASAVPASGNTDTTTSVTSKRSDELASALGPPISSYLPRSDSPQFEDPPMYLQIRVGIPADAENLPRRPHAIVKRVKGRLLEEYWFLIPRSTRNKVYKFIIDWRPEVYGDQEQCRKREHFFYDTRDVMHLIQPIGMSGSPRSPNSAEERLNIIDDHFTVDESWEILSHFDADPHNILIDKNPQDDLNLPEFINGPSVILTPQHVIKLMSALPVNMSVGYNWTLVFSTSRHGFSLSQLYREMREMDPELPVVLCLTDTDQNVFGAYLSTTIRMSENFYGSGSTFLYTFYPEFKHYHWEGDNFYFMNGCKDSFGVGSGEGLFGLWLDGDLDKGRSHRCTTFHNDILTPKEDFHIVHVEAWQLTD